MSDLLVIKKATAKLEGDYVRIYEDNIDHIHEHGFDFFDHALELHIDIFDAMFKSDRPQSDFDFREHLAGEGHVVNVNLHIGEIEDTWSEWEWMNYIYRR